MVSRRALGSTRTAGLPWFLDQPFGARCPQPPRQDRWLRLPVASPPVSGLAQSGSMAAWELRFEAESGSLALRLTPSPREASTARVAPEHRSAGHMCEQAIHMVDSFHSTRLTRLGLAHQNAQI
ncbi:MAG: hypothetical protein V3S64_04975 [bacterium]